MNELAVIIYHSNIQKYPINLLKKSIKSLKEQTYKKYRVFELCYGGDKRFSLMKIFKVKNYTFINKDFSSHVMAENYLMDLVFNKHRFEYCFIMNLDDEYYEDKISKSLTFMKKNNIDLISSNYKISQSINDKLFSKDIKLIEDKDINEQEIFIKSNILNNKLVIQNSGSIISKKYYDTVGKKMNVIPFSDLFFYKIGVRNKMKIYIIPEILMKQNIHSNMVTYKYRINI